MSLSDEVIYDIVAHAVSGAEHYDTQLGTRDPYLAKCFDFAVRSMCDREKGLPFANFAGVETDDGRRIMQAIHAYRGEGHQQLCVEDRARSRRDEVAVRKRIKKLFGTSPQPNPMTAAHTLKTAADLVGGDRNASHGDMAENHQNIASLWEGYLGVSIKPHDVAVMMCLLKIARTKSGRVNPDDYVDLAGYAGIAAEIKGGENNA